MFLKCLLCFPQGLTSKIGHLFQTTKLQDIFQKVQEMTYADKHKVERRDHKQVPQSVSTLVMDLFFIGSQVKVGVVTDVALHAANWFHLLVLLLALI